MRVFAGKGGLREEKELIFSCWRRFRHHTYMQQTALLIAGAEAFRS